MRFLHILWENEFTVLILDFFLPSVLNWIQGLVLCSILSWTVQQDRDGVFLQNKGQVCLMSSITKTMFPSRQVFSRSVSAHNNELGWPQFGEFPQLWHKLTSHLCLPLCSSYGTWAKTNQTLRTTKFSFSNLGSFLSFAVIRETLAGYYFGLTERYKLWPSIILGNQLIWVKILKLCSTSRIKHMWLSCNMLLDFTANICQGFSTLGSS